MKRIISMLLFLIMLCACVPTPEHEYVINKGDSTVEDKINASPYPAEDTVQQEETTSSEPAAPIEAPTQPQRFPDRWDEDAVQINNRVSISVHADVIQKADGLYPVYRIKDAPMSDQMAQELATRFLDKPVEANITEPTKEDYQNELKAYLDEIAEKQAWIDAGKPDDGIDRDETMPTAEEIDAHTKRYMELIQNAPDKLETKAVSDYSGLHLNCATVYTMQSGEKAYVTFYNWGFQMFKNCAFYGELYREYQYLDDRECGEPNTKYWHDVALEQSEAESLLNAELARLGLAEYSIATAERACYLERSQSKGKHYKTNGWAFELKRNPANYPTTDLSLNPSQYLNYGSDDNFMVNEPVREEMLIMFVDENGVQSISFYNRKEVSGMPNANVELLPFEDVKRIAKNTLAMCMPYDIIGERNANIEIYKAMLTTYTMRIKDSDEYYEMPCWALFFDGLHAMDESFRIKTRNTKGTSHEVLLINAIDGSIIHTKYGF